MMVGMLNEHECWKWLFHTAAFQMIIACELFHTLEHTRTPRFTYRKKQQQQQVQQTFSHHRFIHVCQNASHFKWCYVANYEIRFWSLLGAFRSVIVFSIRLTGWLVFRLCLNDESNNNNNEWKWQRKKSRTIQKLPNTPALTHTIIKIKSVTKIE